MVDLIDFDLRVRILGEFWLGSLNRERDFYFKNSNRPTLRSPLKEELFKSYKAFDDSLNSPTYSSIGVEDFGSQNIIIYVYNYDLNMGLSGFCNLINDLGSNKDKFEVMDLLFFTSIADTFYKSFIPEIYDQNQGRIPINETSHQQYSAFLHAKRQSIVEEINSIGQNLVNAFQLEEKENLYQVHYNVIQNGT